MFAYDEFIAKAKLYNQRALNASDSDERGLWLCLGFEFLLRAPLARVSPALLAMPEGDSLLYAVGVATPTKNVKSIPVKSVVERLQKVDAKFGADRAKQALEVVGLRNEELHSSSPALATAKHEDWLPKLLEVSEAICDHLELELGDLFDEELLEEARTYQATAAGATRGLVEQKLKKARQFVENLTELEIAQRLATVSESVQLSRCPACEFESIQLTLALPRTQRTSFDEETGEILYSLVRVVLAAHCAICALTLESTAEVVAAGIERLVRTETTEDRYEGWRDAVSESELHAELENLMDYMSMGEEYGND